MSMQDLQYTDMFLKSLMEGGKTNPITNLSQQAGNLAQLGQLQAFPKFRQDMIQQAANPAGPNPAQMMSSLASYDPKAYAQMADDYLRQQKTDASLDKANNRAIAVEAIPLANSAAEVYRARAIEIGKSTALVAQLTEQFVAEKDEAKKAELQTKLASAGENLSRQQADLSQAQLSYSDAIKKVAMVPGLQTYVTAKLTSAEEIAIDRNIKDAQAKLQDIRIQTEPQLAAAAVRSSNAAATTAGIAAQKAETESRLGSQEQRLAGGFLARMVNNNAYISPMSPSDYLLYKFGEVGFLAGAPKHVLAAKDFIAAQLRRESGAAISNPEYINAMSSYIPSSSDDSSTVEYKAVQRQTLIDGMRSSATPGSGTIIGDDATKDPGKPGAPGAGAPKPVETIPTPPSGKINKRPSGAYFSSDLKWKWNAKLKRWQETGA